MRPELKEMRGGMYLAKFIARLTDGGGTYRDLMETGLSYHTCMRYCRALEEFGRAYIHHWELDDRGIPTRPFWMFCLTKTKNARKPRRSKEYLAEQKRNWRINKLKRASSVFNQHVPRYAEGSRAGQGAT